MNHTKEAAQKVFTALADPTRRRIVELLAEGGQARVSALAQELPITRQAVGQHLDILGEAGMTRTERRGRERLTQLSEAAFEPVRDWLSHYDRFWAERLEILKTQVEKGRDQ